MAKVTVTVALHTFNSAEWLTEQLDAIYAQVMDRSFEVLAIDSGSSDDTLAIFASYPMVRLHKIPNNEFGHGKTRNLSAHLADSEFIVFLTHDAIPAHNQWLAEMIAPFSLSPEIVCCYGKQIPRTNCCPTVKRDVISLFAQHGPNYGITVQAGSPLITDLAQNDAIRFFSDVNSSLRLSLFKTIPYRDLNYAEDQAMGQDVIAAGHSIAYTPFGSVIHSHSYAPRKYFRRMYDEMIGLKAATGQSINTSLLHHAEIVAAGTLHDWRFILRDRDYKAYEKLVWVVQAPVYNLARRTAVWLADRKTLPTWAARSLSLEHKSRSKSA